MANSLHAVFHAIANVPNEQELRLALADKISEHFGVQNWGIYLLDEQPTAEIDVPGIPAVCLESNPVGRYVVERHAPAHEQLILSPADWKQFCSRHDHEHVMTGPIVCDGRLVGTLNLARDKGNPPFNGNDLADLSALCIHLSAKMATLRLPKGQRQRRSQPKISNSFLESPLTPRELEIAELVAQGLTNAEIGEQLWITQNSVKQALKRMFRKLGVSARTEMIAKLHSISAYQLK